MCFLRLQSHTVCLCIANCEHGSAYIIRMNLIILVLMSLFKEQQQKFHWQVRVWAHHGVPRQPSILLQQKRVYLPQYLQPLGYHRWQQQFIPQQHQLWAQQLEYQQRLSQKQLLNRVRIQSTWNKTLNNLILSFI